MFLGPLTCWLLARVMRMRGMMGQARHCNERDALLVALPPGGAGPYDCVCVCAPEKRKEGMQCEGHL